MCIRVLSCILKFLLGIGTLPVTSSQPRAGQAGLPLNLFIPCHPSFQKWVSIPPSKTFYCPRLGVPGDFSKIYITFWRPCVTTFTLDTWQLWCLLPLSSDLFLKAEWLAGNIDTRLVSSLLASIPDRSLSELWAQKWAPPPLSSFAPRCQTTL